MVASTCKALTVCPYFFFEHFTQIFCQQSCEVGAVIFFFFFSRNKTEVKSLDQGYTVSGRFQTQAARTLCVKEGGAQRLREG